MRFVHLAARVFNTPLMIEESKLSAIMAAIGPRFDFDLDIDLEVEVPNPAPDAVSAGNPRGLLRRFPNVVTMDAGIAVIEVNGTLVNRYATAPSGKTSYDRIKDQLAAAVGNPVVRGIMLRIDSYGGEVDGVFELGEEIRRAAKAKPLWASIDGSAFSAGYLLASQADRVWVTRTGGAGSVGVIWMHADMSKANEKDGIKVTTITAGAKKDWMSPHAPLAEGAEKMMRERVAALYGDFVKAVADARGMSVDAVRATEAGLYFGQEAVDIGFATDLGTFEDALNAFQAAVSAAPTSGGLTAKISGGNMSQELIPAASAETAPTVEAVNVERERSVAAQAERARIKAILECEAAVNRQGLARTIALTTDLTAEQAGAILAAAAEETTVSGSADFASAMAAAGNPQIGPDASALMSEEDKEIAALRMLIDGK